MMAFNILALTGEQIRAARALSRIEQAELARLSGLSIETIKRLERIRGPVEANARTLRAIQDAFHALGVKFDGDETGRIGVSANGEPLREQAKGRQAAQSGPQKLQRLVFSSKLVREGQESLRPTLAFVEVEARAILAGTNVSSTIFVREGQVLQMLEGEREAVHQTYQTIASYPQHENLRVVEDIPVEQRTFQDFTFCCGLFPTDALSVDHSSASHSFDPQRLTPQTASTLLANAHALQKAVPRNRRGRPGTCTLASTCLDSTCSSNRHAGPPHTPQAH